MCFTFWNNSAYLWDPKDSPGVSVLLVCPFLSGILHRGAYQEEEEAHVWMFHEKSSITIF